MHLDAHAPPRLVDALELWRCATTCPTWPPKEVRDQRGANSNAVNEWNVVLRPRGAEVLHVSASGSHCLAVCLHVCIHYQKADPAQRDSTRELLISWVAWYHDHHGFPEELAIDILVDAGVQVADLTMVPQHEVRDRAIAALQSGCIPIWALYIIAAKFQARVWLLRWCERRDPYHHHFPLPSPIRQYYLTTLPPYHLTTLPPYHLTTLPPYHLTTSLRH